MNCLYCLKECNIDYCCDWHRLLDFARKQTNVSNWLGLETKECDIVSSDEE